MPDTEVIHACLHTRMFCQAKAHPQKKKHTYAYMCADSRATTPISLQGDCSKTAQMWIRALFISQEVHKIMQDMQDRQAEQMQEHVVRCGCGLYLHVCVQCVYVCCIGHSGCYMQHHARVCIYTCHVCVYTHARVNCRPVCVLYERIDIKSSVCRKVTKKILVTHHWLKTALVLILKFI